MNYRYIGWLALCCVVLSAFSATARAEMVLSQVIVDLLPGKPLRDDIEVWNSSDERMYVSADPFRILAPGTPQEQRTPLRLADDVSLLVSPRRLVLEPGERRIIRIAAVDRPQMDAVYRLAIRPVAGIVASDADALKVFVGYDALVLVRPDEVQDNLQSSRFGRTLRLRNEGNTSQELFDGRQCDASGKDCLKLPSKRLYAQSEWTQELPFDTPVFYKSTIGGKVVDRWF